MLSAEIVEAPLSLDGQPPVERTVEPANLKIENRLRQLIRPQLQQRLHRSPRVIVIIRRGDRCNDVAPSAQGRFERVKQL
jgi:hypothetical protein